MNNKLKTQVKLNKTLQYHSHLTRQRETLRNELRRTNKTQNSPIYRSINIFNSAPSDLINIRDWKKFCHALKYFMRLG